jgi:preprotein translocase subunit SecA
MAQPEEPEEIELEEGRSFASEIEEENQPRANVELLELPVTPIHVEGHVGRNALCPCGSGKKFKKCCGLDTPDEGEG